MGMSQKMKARLLGTIAGGSIGAMLGMGTGIVGGAFGAVAGFSIFTIIGLAWGFSAGPDLARAIARWRSKKPQ